MNVEKRRKKRIRNSVCITWCFLQLAIVLLLFTGMDHIFDKILEGGSVETIQGDIADVKDDGEAEEEKGLLVCLDAGHGGSDNGSDYKQRYEKNDTLKIAKAVEAYLKSQGVGVVMTRNDDTKLSVKERCNIANEEKVDYFVSLHRNDNGGYGVETWISSMASDETKELAENIMQGLNEAGIQRDRGIKIGTQKSSSKDYYVNVNTDMPACLVELGFIDNDADNQLLDEKLEMYGKAIGDAIIKTYAGHDGKDQNLIGGETEAGKTEESEPEAPFQAAVIPNVESLANTSQDWGQGTNVDEKNRPVSAVSYQEKYGAYHALFIGEETNTIYLTFDEGYEYGCTESILNTLKEKGIKAVFFVTEPYAKDQPELVRRMIDEGHTIGNHSVTHPAAGLPSQSIEVQQQEVMGNHQYILDNFGYQMHLFRYPAGKFSEQSLAVINNCNYKSVFWSFAYVDYDVKNQPDHKESLKKMTDKLHPGAIYLLHAESETNAAVLGDFIDQVKAAGYEFGVLD